MPESFRAKKCTIDGYTFDSMSEGRRYQELKLLHFAGEISEIEVHPEMVLFPARNGQKAITFRPDFLYYDQRRSAQVIQDVKPFKVDRKGNRVPYLTDVFKLQWRLLQYCYPGRIYEIVEA